MSIKGTFFFLFLTTIFSIIFINTKSIVILCIFLLLCIFLYKKFNFTYVFICGVIFTFFCFYKVNNIPTINEEITSNTYVVKTVKEKYMIIKNDNVNYLVYIDEEDVFYKNDEVNIYGKVSSIENDLELDTFEFKDYLNKQRVFYQVNIYDYEIVNRKIPLSTKIIDYITSNLEDESYKMTKMLLFNDKSIDEVAYDNLKEINAIHLFVVSGFHISFFYSLITKLFKKKSVVGKVIGLTVCFFYLFLLDFSLSATRALISLFINKLFSKYFNKLDAISIAGLILLVIEPLNLFSYSFIMSFVMVYVITFSNAFLYKKNKIIQTLSLALICFLALLPVQLLINYKLNFISLLTNTFLSYMVIVIFVLCIIGIPISFIYPNLFGFIYDYFNQGIERISLLNTSIIFGSVKPWMIIIYYLLFVIFLLALEKKKTKIIVSSFLSIILGFILLYNRAYFNPYQKVTFLNVYQGDCTIIQDSFNNKVIMIDTGGLLNYDIANKKIMPYLNYQGIRKIDVLVLTHNDYDHIGASEELIKQIKVNQIIDDNSTKEFSVGKLTFTNLNTYEGYDDNDSSITLYTDISGVKFLFTGDISKNIEKQIIKDNPTLDIDVLKVAHHGSNTSSSEEFIQSITPTYGIISVGKNNHYGHPNEEVIGTLTEYEVDIYMTSIDGTIRFVIKKDNKYFIETAK